MLAAGLAFTSAPAQASERPIDVTGYSVSDITISGPGCRYFTVTASTAVQGDFLDSSGSIEISRQGMDISSVFIDGRKVTNRAFACPSSSGLGVYKVGPASIDADFKFYHQQYKKWSTGYAEYVDYTSKTFNVRGKAKSTLSAKRSGSKVTLTAKAKVYTPSKFEYTKYNASGAKIQVKSGSKWKTLKSVKLKSGEASVTVKQSKKKTYRLYIPKTSWATSSTSKSVSK